MQGKSIFEGALVRFERVCVGEAAGEALSSSRR